VDDFLVVAEESRTGRVLGVVQDLLGEVGLQTAPEKTQGPATKVEWIG